jgi:hypothetical protein
MRPIPPRAQSILDYISTREAPRGYVDYFRGSKIPPPKALTDMTVREVRDWQRRAVAAGSYSAAAGKYQIIGKTLDSLIADLKLTGNEKFDPAMQEQMGFALLRRRGWDQFEAGRITAEKFANNLAMEWAALPVIGGTKHGRSYYAADGVNKAGFRPEDVLSVVTGQKSVTLPTTVSSAPAGDNGGMPVAPGPFSETMKRFFPLLWSAIRWVLDLVRKGRSTRS